MGGVGLKVLIKELFVCAAKVNDGLNIPILVNKLLPGSKVTPPPRYDSPPAQHVRLV